MNWFSTNKRSAAKGDTARRAAIALCWLLCLALCAVTLFPLPAPVLAAPEQPTPLKEDQITAQAAILAEASSGKVLFSKNADVRLYPASITKVMSAMLVLEHAKLDEQVTITAEAVALPADSSSINLKKDEVLSVEQLLYGLMLNSGNDAANALGIHVAGSVAAFVQMMNARALELGMANTHYVNPHGLHDENHYTTVSDMLTLTMEARKSEMFRTLVSTTSYTLPATNMRPQPTTWKNSNLLIQSGGDNLYYNEYATGVKTGYTSPAQHTLVSSASKNGMDLIAIVLKDTKEGKWNSCNKMFANGFYYYRTLNVEDLLQSQTVKAKIANAAADDLYGGEMVFTLVPDETSILVDTTEKIEQIKNRVDDIVITPDKNLETLEAPLKEGVVVARFTATLDSETILTGSLKTSRAITNVKGQNPNNVTQPEPAQPVLEADWPLYVLALVGLLLLFILIFSVVRTIRIKRRRKRMRALMRGNRRHYR